MSAAAFVMPNDLSDLCRVCLQLPEESQYLDLTTIYDEDDNLTYGECFTICTQIDLSVGEGVPHHLCKTCGLELQMSYDFHKKIEESKRVIEQCQKQIEEQKRSSSREDPQRHTNAREESRDVVKLLSEKYVISDDDDEDVEEELAGTSQEMQVVSIMETEYDRETQEEDETDEMDIISKICHIEDITQQEDEPDKDNTNLEHIDEHDMAEDAEEMDDYQNLEALEDEEKRQKLLTNVKIKTEPLNEEQIKEISEVYKISTEEIKDEISMENTDDNQDPLTDSSQQTKENTTAEVIKIENEMLSEYIVPSPPPRTTPFVCEVCNYNLPTKNALYKHRLRKHNLKGFAQQGKPLPINCHLCSKVFDTTSSLKQHINAGHLNKGFVCEYCGYNLPTKNALYQHRLRKHREKQQMKRFRLKCLQCSELFSSAESLRSHRVSQHGWKKRYVPADKDKWFECVVCGYKLPSKNAVYQHRLRKHRRKLVAKEIVLDSNESLQTQSHKEVLPALKQLVDRL